MTSAKSARSQCHHTHTTNENHQKDSNHKSNATHQLRTNENHQKSTNIYRTPSPSRNRRTHVAYHPRRDREHSNNPRRRSNARALRMT